MTASPPETKWYFCVGMRRGGSTLQTQLTSAILGDAPMLLSSAETIDDQLARYDGPFPVILKFHEFLPQTVPLQESGVGKILYVYRDPRDAAASLRRKYNMSDLALMHGAYKGLILEYQRWTAIPGIYVARYESMIADLEREVRSIAAYLDVDLSDERVRELVEKYSIDKQKESIEETFEDGQSITGSGGNQFSSKTLLHKNHIQSRGPGEFVEIFPQRTRAALEWIGASWLRSHDYDFTTSYWERLAAISAVRGKAMLHDTRKRLFGSSSVSQKT